MVAVLGISQSSKAGLLSEIAKLGNLLEVAPGQTLSGQQTELPYTAQQMVAQIGPVTYVTGTGNLHSTYIYRNDKISSLVTSGVEVQAADTDLLPTLGATISQGQYLNPANDHYPTVVLGAQAAQALGVDRLTPLPQVWLGNRWFTVIGILDPVPLAPEIDRSALIGYPVAEQLFGFDGHPSELYVRCLPSQTQNVQAVLGRSANPAHPDQVVVTHPTDTLAAQAAAKGAYTSLFLGLGAVALLVGGVGIANIMVISVLERRAEIGLRRALGATAGHIRLQFLTEAVTLTTLGGIAGTLIGVAATAIYAATQHWAIVIPAQAAGGGLAAALAVGTLAGLYPAMRAARLTPTQALRTI
jgi:putative ABC transport system permease protein